MNLPRKQAQVTAMLDRLYAAANQVRQRRSRRLFPGRVEFKMMGSAIRLGWELLGFVFGSGSAAQLDRAQQALADYEQACALAMREQ